MTFFYFQFFICGLFASIMIQFLASTATNNSACNKRLAFLIRKLTLFTSHGINACFPTIPVKKTLQVIKLIKKKPNLVIYFFGDRLCYEVVYQFWAFYDILVFFKLKFDLKCQFIGSFHYAGHCMPNEEPINRLKRI